MKCVVRFCEEEAVENSVFSDSVDHVRKEITRTFKNCNHLCSEDFKEFGWSPEFKSRGLIGLADFVRRVEAEHRNSIREKQIKEKA